MDLPDFDLPGRCHPSTTHIRDTSISSHITWVVSLSKRLKTFDILLHLSKLRPKITFRCRLIGSFLVVSDLLSNSLQPIIPHGNRIRIVNIHQNQVSFILWQHCRYLLNEKYNILWYFNVTFNMAEWYLVLMSEPPWVPACNWWKYLMIMILLGILVFYYLVP